MTTESWIMLAILAAIFALLIWRRWPTWAIVRGTLTVTMTLDLAPIVYPF